MGIPQDQKKPASSGIVEELENLLASGYGKKENLRAFDKKLREQYYAELMSLRHQWEKIYLEVLEAGQAAIGSECKVAIQTIDRLAAAVNRADYGYAPLFDRVNKIQEEALNRVLEYDRGLAKSLTQINQDVANAEAALKTSTWPTLSNHVDALNNDLKIFEEYWGKRKQVMNDSLERR